VKPPGVPRRIPILRSSNSFMSNDVWTLMKVENI